MPKHDKKRRYRYSSSDDEEVLLRKYKKIKRQLRERDDRYRSPSLLCLSPSTQPFSGDETIDEPETIQNANVNVNTEEFTDLRHEEGLDHASIAPSAPELDNTILEIIGEEPPDKQLYSPPFHKDIASRWTKMLKSGLSSEEKITLIKKYPYAENCPLLTSPQLNPEVAKVINNQVTRRDEKFCAQQNQIGAALSALGQLLTGLLAEKGGSNMNYIRLASDAGKLLLDFHQIQSVTRRELIAINLKKELKDTLTNVSPDGWLFGENLSDRIKAAEELEKSSLDLKQKVLKKPASRPLVNDKISNYRSPPRLVQSGHNTQQAFQQLVQPGGSHGERLHNTQQAFQQLVQPGDRQGRRLHNTHQAFQQLVQPEGSQGRRLHNTQQAFQQRRTDFSRKTFRSNSNQDRRKFRTENRPATQTKDRYKP